MKRVMDYLTENTMVPLSLAVIVIGGGAVWLTVLASTVQSSADTLKEIKGKQEKYNEDISQIRTDIAVIKSKMEVWPGGK